VTAGAVVFSEALGKWSFEMPRHSRHSLCVVPTSWWHDVGKCVPEVRCVAIGAAGGRWGDPKGSSTRVRAEAVMNCKGYKKRSF